MALYAFEGVDVEARLATLNDKQMHIACSTWPILHGLCTQNLALVPELDGKVHRLAKP